MPVVPLVAQVPAVEEMVVEQLVRRLQMLTQPVETTLPPLELVRLDLLELQVEEAVEALSRPLLLPPVGMALNGLQPGLGVVEELVENPPVKAACMAVLVAEPVVSLVVSRAMGRRGSL